MKPRRTLMRSLSVLFVAILSSCSSTAQKAPPVLQWQQVTSLPAAGRHHPVTFANETHGFLLTGTAEGAGSAYLADMYIYEASTDTWTRLADFPGAPRSFAYGIVLPLVGNSKAYMGFGAAANRTRLADLWEFDMISLVWKRLADCPGPGRRHPAMNVVQNGGGDWEIHVGFGDGVGGNYKDWYSYDIATNQWSRRTDFPGTARHHPFYFALANNSYVGLGHSSVDPFIERDFYHYDTDTDKWTRMADFASYNRFFLENNNNDTTLVSTEARVAGTQFSMEFVGNNEQNKKRLGFVLSGDGDNHNSMETGEFHGFDGDEIDTPPWFALPPHPGASRWAPGSFVLRGSTTVYFVAGYDRTTGILHRDMWKMDLSNLTNVLFDEDNAPALNSSSSSEEPTGSPSSPSAMPTISLQPTGAPATMPPTRPPSSSSAPSALPTEAPSNVVKSNPPSAVTTAELSLSPTNEEETSAATWPGRFRPLSLVLLVPMLLGVTM